MPSDVRVGLVIGAEIAALVVLALSPWDTVPTGIGDLLAGLNLSYGTESMRSCSDNDV